jgi:pimeloyl-ACP methyl ester carboxylesterase
VPNLNVDGIRVHYRESGAGQPVVLLHGGGSSGAQWRKVNRMLEHRYRLITVDHYGFGSTDPWPGSPEERSHDAEADLVRAVMAHTCGKDPVHLVGHSYGGGVALRLMAKDPTPVRSLVLVEPMAMSVLNDAGEEEHYRALVEIARGFIEHVRAGRSEEAWQTFFDANNGPGAWDALPEETRGRFIVQTETGFSAYHANLGHSTTLAECRALTLPVTVFHGAETSPRYRRMTEVIAEAIPGARLESIPGAGHMSMLTHPEAVARLLGAHLESV